MAEHHVYGNYIEPAFPLHDVLPCLHWLSGEVEKYAVQTPVPFDIILNIILVFVGARTSALLQNLTTDYRPFINRLNLCLDMAGASDFTLEVEQFYMGDWIFRRNNPRFIRKHRLTTREIGQNLDMFAAGNIPRSMDEKRVFVEIVEMRTWTQVTAEVVLDRCLKEGDNNRLAAFTQAKVDLFNRVFEELGLKYRFAWFCPANDTPRERERVMNS